MDYGYSFQDNILSSTFNSTSNNILNWIKENRDKFDWAKDPNAYEMTNLFLFAAKHSHEGNNINIDTLNQMWDIRSKDFNNCNISNNNFVYLICQDAYESAVSGNPMVTDENSHHALRKMAGIGLYLMQQQRDTGRVSYNNPQELLQLLQCSESFKKLHPELFNKYLFGKNLNVLCRLQLENELSNEVIQAIKTSQNNLSDVIIASQHDNTPKTVTESDIEIS